MPLSALNPSATPFALAPSSSSSTSSSSPTSSAFNTDTPVTPTDFDATATTPLWVKVKLNKSKDVGTADDKPSSPTVARLGDTWKTSFPASPNDRNKTKAHDDTARTPRQRHSTALSSRGGYMPTHRTKTPSLPNLILSDKERVLINATGESHSAHPALKHLSPANKTKFELFGKSEPNSPVRQTHNGMIVGRTSQPTTPTRPSFATNTNGNTLDSLLTRHQEVYTVSDVGEGRNVYLPELNPAITEEALRKKAQHFGRVVSVKVEHSGTITADTVDMLPDGAARNSRTYAFVMFDTRLAANNFMQELQACSVTAQYGKETPNLQQKALEDPYSSNLYVAEIPLNMTEEEMHNLLFPGIVSSMRFLTDASGNRRGTAMVRLQSRAQAEEAIGRLNNVMVMPGCHRPIQVRIADSEQQKQLKRTPMNIASPQRDSIRRMPSLGILSIPPAPPASPVSACPSSPSPLAVDDDALAQHIELCKAELARRRTEQLARTTRVVSKGAYATPHQPAFDKPWGQTSSPAKTSPFNFTSLRESLTNVSGHKTTATWGSLDSHGYTSISSDMSSGSDSSDSNKDKEPDTTGYQREHTTSVATGHKRSHTTHIVTARQGAAATPDKTSGRHSL